MHVAAGTYNETRVAIGKALTLLGADRDTTIIDGQHISPPNEGIVRVEGAGGTVVIEGFTIQNPALDLHYGFAEDVVAYYTDHPVTVQNCLLLGNGHAEEEAIGVYAFQNHGTGAKVTVTACEFSGLYFGFMSEYAKEAVEVSNNNIHDFITDTSEGGPYSPIGIDIYGDGGQGLTSQLIDIHGNNIHDYFGRGIQLYAEADSKFTNVSIVGNTITAIGNSDSAGKQAGIRFYNEAGDTTTGFYGVTITGNTITGVDGGTTSRGIWFIGPNDNATITNDNAITHLWRGISVEANGGAASGLAVHGNTISGNGTGAYNGSSSSMDATCNWWGSDTGPYNLTANPGGAGNPVTDNVIFAPWATTGSPGYTCSGCVTATAGSHPSPVCENGTLYLTTPTIAGATYHWTGPNGFLSDLQNPSITPVTPAAGGTYTVTVTVGTCVRTADTNVVTVNAVPRITTPPQNVVVCLGGSATFSVAATGATLSYQWYKSPGTPVGTNSNTFTINPVGSGDAGSYYVVVSGTCSPPATSDTVTLTIDTPDPATTVTVTNPDCIGAMITFTPSAMAISYELWVDGVRVNAHFSSGGRYTPPDGLSHSYVVRAIRNLCFADSASVSFTVTNLTPPAISDLQEFKMNYQIGGIWYYNLLFNWKLPDDPSRVDSYEVMRCTVSSPPINGECSQDSDFTHLVGTTSGNLNGLQVSLDAEGPGNYDYKIRAVKGSCLGPL